jgi:cbb3-type cytochrome oxidase subunit 3
MRRARATAVALAVLSAVALGGLVHAQMPDVRQMSGIPMPSGDVPAGTIVVRVIRGDLSNNIPNQPVELHVAGRVLKAQTDETGRASFSGVPIGADAHAITTVDGERLESGHIELGASTGVRVMLVAGAGAGTAPPAATAPAGPAIEGDVTFGGQSRIQIEFDDDRVEVYYLLDVVNRSTSPVNPTSELTFTLPDDAESPAMLEGSSTQAQVRGRVVSISGPFAPGATPVQVAFALTPGRANRVLSQTLPAPWEQVQVIVSQAGNVQVSSEQFASNTVMPGEGRGFHLGTGPALAAGNELRVTLSGLPVRSRAGRWLAIVLAVVLLAVGAWAAWGGQRVSAADARRAELEGRRQKLMSELARVEGQRRSGDSPRLVARREELIGQLERVYGELDQQTTPPATA